MKSPNRVFHICFPLAQRNNCCSEGAATDLEGIFYMCWFRPELFNQISERCVEYQLLHNAEPNETN